MHRIFSPDSLVVIGASQEPDNLAAVIIDNLQRFGYQGDIHAVGLNGGEVHGTRILESVDELPDGVHLAVILTPAATVPGLLEACARRSIRRAVIESGGFAEFSDEGLRLQQQLRDVAERENMRFVGPNCISAVNTGNGLCLPFVPIDRQTVKQGPVSVVAQSGGVAVTYMLMLSQAGIGVNKVVSVGNKVNLNETDYLNFLRDDPATEVILLYLESVDEGRRLMELAATSPKPIIVHKAYTHEASEQIALSHTAALATDNRILRGALRQTRCAQAHSFQDGVALAKGFTLPPVRGNSLVIISRAGGHAVLAADAAGANGFQLTPIPDRFAKQVRELFRADVVALTNPLDVGVLFDFDAYATIAEECLRTLDPDALLFVHSYTAAAEGESSRRMVRRLSDLGRELGKPVALCLFAPQYELALLTDEVDHPVFTGIESAVRALAASRDRFCRPEQVLTIPLAVRARPAEVSRLLNREGVLTPDTALSLCAAYGVETAEWAVAQGAESAAAAAGTIGYPVALKVLSADVSHKTDVGGVALDLDGPEAVLSEYAALIERVRSCSPGAQVSGVLVQRMLSGGREVILGGTRDPSFGPVVLFGLGGVYVEALEEVVFRLVPLTREQAEEMVSEVRGGRLLGTCRGRQAGDVEAVVSALLAISEMLAECPEIIEVDINPLLVFEQGALAVDARVVVGRHAA